MDMRNYLCKLDKIKPVIYCGDLNVARCELDLKNPKSNEGNPGYSKQERSNMEELLGSGFIDSFRTLHPEEVKYSWWSYRFQARAKGIGWRIDYFLTSKALDDKLLGASIHTEVFGSDHCPVELTIN